MQMKCIDWQWVFFNSCLKTVSNFPSCEPRLQVISRYFENEQFVGAKFRILYFRCLLNFLRTEQISDHHHILV